MDSISERKKIWKQMIENEEKLTIKQVTQLPPKPRASTVRNWITAGVTCRQETKKGKKVKVYLETIKIGGCIYTTREALQRFYERIEFGTEVVDGLPG